MVFQDIECTRIGRYASGERPQVTRGHPIVQFLSNPHYKTSGLEFSRQEGIYCAYAHENAEVLPARIASLGDSVQVLDVGCSSGANLFLLRDLLQRSTDKPVVVRGYDNGKARLKKAKKGKAVYHSLECLLHPVVREVVDKYFIEEEKGSQVEGSERGYRFSLRRDARKEMGELLFFGDARNLPEENNASNATICLYVLRHHQIADQLKIFKELLRVTKPGGYIFTEEFVFKKEGEGVIAQHPKINTVISFYNPRKILWYLSDEEPERELIWPVSNARELD